MGNLSAATGLASAWLLAATLWTGPATAGFETGHSLKALCTSDDLAGKAVCLGYVLGVHDALGAARYFCVPGTMTAGEVRDIVTEYLRTNTEKLDFSADTLVLLALAQARPCEGGAPGGPSGESETSPNSEQ